MNKEGVKIVTIGGGSSYTPELMEGFIKRYDELPIREIWLCDIEDGKEKLEKLVLKFTLKQGDKGRVFGSISTKQISEDLKKNHGYDVDKRKMHSEAIAAIGFSKISVELYKGVVATLTIEVKPE